MTKREIVLFFFVTLLFNGIAQEARPKIKFGKADEEELLMKRYPMDTAAHAVVLFDSGETEFEYDLSGDKGWQLVFKRHVRVKILDASGVAAANQTFKLYREGNLNREKLESVEGFTINLEDGKAVRTKLDKSSIMESELDKKHLSVTIAMPKVREGSIIDLKYRIRSDFIMNLQPWRFQHAYPVVWSEYKVGIPEYFNYKHSLLGYNPLKRNEITNETKRITMQSKNRELGRNTSYETDTWEYNVRYYNLMMNNVPAFYEEEYLTTPDNYLSIYQFELSSFQQRGSITNFTGNWEKINTLLLEEEDFGRSMGKKSYMEDALSTVLQNLTGEKVKAAAIIEMVRSKIRWDKSNSLFAGNVKTAWMEGKGNAADINLNLISALRMAGLKADPVVLSTRNHGVLNPAHPVITDFNYVVARLIADGDTLLADATEPCLPLGMLPVRCLNGKGRLVEKAGGLWVNLQPKPDTRHFATYTLKVQDDGTIAGEITRSRTGYYALDFRKQLKEADSKSAFYKGKANRYDGLAYTAIQVTNIDTLDQPVNETLSFTYTGLLDTESDMLLISPLLFDAITSNPFRMKERTYPVEFPYPFSETLIINWNLPNGYGISQLPAPAVVVLPNRGGKFTYNVTGNGNIVTVTSIIQLSQSVFIGSEYNNIKDFFSNIIAKQGESIILKKL